MNALNESPELAATAYKIADSWSMCDIESNAVAAKSLGCRWWDTSQLDDLDDGGLVFRGRDGGRFVHVALLS